MCFPLGIELPINLGIQITWGEGFSISGLLLDLLGIGLITFSGILGQKPFRRLKRLYFEVDRSELDDSEETSKDIGLVETIERSPDSELASDPVTKGDYDELMSRLPRLLIGATALFIGLILQIVGTAIC